VLKGQCQVANGGERIRFWHLVVMVALDGPQRPLAVWALGDRSLLPGGR
jgi:hypothetical protein